LSRNIGYRGPGEANWDLSIFKDVTFKERYKAQFRAEALNAFNTPLFANPNMLLNGANFGKLVYQTNTPRELQFGLRFAWQAVGRTPSSARGPQVALSRSDLSLALDSTPGIR